MATMQYFAATAVAQAIKSTITVAPPGGTSRPKPPVPPSDPTTPHYSWRIDPIERSGKIALWVFFGVFAAALVGVAFLSAKVEKKWRLYHTLSSLALGFLTLGYLAMATGLGSNIGVDPNLLPHGHPHEPGTIHIVVRQVFWIADIARVVSSPLLITQLALLSGISPIAALAAITYSVFSILSSLAATWASAIRVNDHVGSAWIVWFVVMVFWAAGLFVTLFIPGVNASHRRPSKTRGLYFLLTILVFLGFIDYATLHILSGPFTVVSPNVLVITNGAADVVYNVGFVYFLLLTHAHTDEDNATLPQWFIEPRAPGDGQGQYQAVPTDAPAAAAEAA